MSSKVKLNFDPKTKTVTLSFAFDPKAKDFPVSKSGNSFIVATTGGNKAVTIGEREVKIGLNVYIPNGKKASSDGGIELS